MSNNTNGILSEELDDMTKLRLEIEQAKKDEGNHIADNAKETPSNLQEKPQIDAKKRRRVVHAIHKESPINNIPSPSVEKKTIGVKPNVVEPSKVELKVKPKENKVSTKRERTKNVGTLTRNTEKFKKPEKVKENKRIKSIENRPVKHKRGFFTKLDLYSVIVTVIFIAIIQLSFIWFFVFRT